MAYFGKIHEKLRKSILVEELGYKYFGINYEQWLQDINDYKGDEDDNIIDPVYIDNGKYFLEFSAPNNAIQRFYLDDFNELLTGNIIIQHK